MLRAIDATTAAAAGTDVWVGMCGEMAGDPELTELLVGLGLTELSMSAVTVPDVKARVESIDVDAARELADRALAASSRREVTEMLPQR